MSEGRWVAIGAFLAALAVGLGAFGAHVLEGKLEPKYVDAFEVGARYHLIHSLALILVGVLAGRWQTRAVSLAGMLLLVGIVFFSGGIYAWVLTQIKTFVHIVPIGGLAFLAGWTSLAIAAARR